MIPSSSYTRRDVLAGMATVAAGMGLRGVSWAEMHSGGAKDTDFVSGRIEPFPMPQVRLLGSDFKTGSEINQEYLASLATDRLLYSFRATAGLKTPGATYGGWESPTCELRGHFNGGHYLSAVAFAYASAGNDTLRKNGDAVVSGLAQCQKALGNGYVSAYPAALFEGLAKGKKVWAPFYTLHKIVAGLLDMYVHTGNEEALQVAEGVAGWVQEYFQGISDDQRAFMLRTEYGGMNEVLANLYGLTGKERYLRTARLFEQASFLDPLAGHRDELNGLHANTHVPKVIGAARMYELTGESRYRDIAAYFLGEVLAERSYAIGNTSNYEFWQTDPGVLAGSLSFKDAECCVAYNLMKLDRHLFAWTGDARWMDAYERSLFNCRLGTQNPQGLKQYFVPLAAGYWRHYNSKEESFWCCTGTGAEEFAKFNDSIYFHDRENLYVNQFIASELQWPEKKMTVRQETTFPAEQKTTLYVRTDAPPQKRTIYVRIPAWVAEGGAVRINGQELEAFAQAGSYLALTRVWHDNDKVEVLLPMSLRTEPLAGDVTMQAALYGPLVLAADLGPGPIEGPLKIGEYDPAPKVVPPPEASPRIAVDGKTEWMEIVSAKDLSFRTAGQQSSQAVRPFYRITDQKYSVYWKTENRSVG